MQLPRDRGLAIGWSALELCYFAAGVILLVVPQVWRGQGQSLGADTLHRLVTSEMHLNATALGALFTISGAVGLFGFYQGLGVGNGNRSGGMQAFGCTLVCTALAGMSVASIIWFYSLTEREDYRPVWQALGPETRMFLQDQLSCCGYWNATSAGLLLEAVGFCASITNATAVTPCVTPIAAEADKLLNDSFTTVYGFTTIPALLFLTTCALVINRRELERFRSIEEKRSFFE